MNYVLGYRCTLCQKEYKADLNLYTCPACGTEGILDILYDYGKMKKKVTARSLAANKNYSMWRYAPFLTVPEENLDRTLRVGWTPLYTANWLAGQLGLRALYIKDDGLNPTGSLKDRASAVAVIKAFESGKDIIGTSSTGNAASSLAGNAARMGVKTVIFVPERAPAGKVAQLLIYGAKVISVLGNYRQTFELSQQAIERWGWYNRNCAINPHLVEGKKTVALEIAEQLNWDVPDWVAVSVGDGCTVGGVYKGFYDLLQLGLIEKIPQILGVQAEGCSPIVRAFKNGKSNVSAWEEPHTVAHSIADPLNGYPEDGSLTLKYIRESHGVAESVTDEEMVESVHLLARTEGLFAEPSSAATIAVIRKLKNSGTIGPDDIVVPVITGTGLKSIGTVSVQNIPEVDSGDIKSLAKISQS